MWSEGLSDHWLLNLFKLLHFLHELFYLMYILQSFFFSFFVSCFVGGLVHLILKSLLGFCSLSLSLSCLKTKCLGEIVKIVQKERDAPVWAASLCRPGHSCPHQSGTGSLSFVFVTDFCSSEHTTSMIFIQHKKKEMIQIWTQWMNVLQNAITETHRRVWSNFWIE